MEAIEITVGLNLKRLRKLKDLTQEELAQQIGVTPLTVRNWEKGIHHISQRHIDKICEALHCAVSDLTAPQKRKPPDIEPEPTPQDTTGEKILNLIRELQEIDPDMSLQLRIIARHADKLDPADKHFLASLFRVALGHISVGHIRKVDLEEF